MSTHHTKCIVCHEDCYCTSESPWWLGCGVNGGFSYPTAVCSSACAEFLRKELEAAFKRAVDPEWAE
jgi:hypothetical protein